MIPTRFMYTVPGFWDNPFKMFDRDLGKLLNAPNGDNPKVGFYPVDVHEDDDHLYVDAELPGFAKDDIHITLEKGILSINAQRKEKETKGHKHLSERRYTKMSRSFSLSVEVEEAEVEAKLAEGLLHITLNKKAEIKPRKIEVN
jgi:HSP20 family protein